MDRETNQHELLVKYLEGRTTPAELRRLNTLLRETPGLAGELAFLARQHLHLYELAEERALRTDPRLRDEMTLAEGCWGNGEPGWSRDPRFDPGKRPAFSAIL